MACLGWALTSPGSNLVISGSASGAAPAVIRHMLLLGVGRCIWYLAPFTWVLLRGLS